MGKGKRPFLRSSPLTLHTFLAISITIGNICYLQYIEISDTTDIIEYSYKHSLQR